MHRFINSLTKHLISASFITAIAMFIAPLGAQISTTLPVGADLPKVTIALVGDSTVAVENGWGTGFACCLSHQVQVTNLARNGRSSMSFINEGIWQKCLDLKPDYVLIQFGHNDQKLEDPQRGTQPETTYRQYMTRYVDEARAAGITPILVTSLSRRQWGEGGHIHSTLLPYVKVVKEIAAQKHVPLIDLHKLSIQRYEKLGKAEIDTMSPLKPSTAPSSIIDNTHLNAKGGQAIGTIVADELVKVVPALAAYRIAK